VIGIEGGLYARSVGSVVANNDDHRVRLFRVIVELTGRFTASPSSPVAAAEFRVQRFDHLVAEDPELASGSAGGVIAAVEVVGIGRGRNSDVRLLLVGRVG
jgi:hypothetical protein